MACSKCACWSFAERRACQQQYPNVLQLGTSVKPGADPVCCTALLAPVSPLLCCFPLPQIQTLDIPGEVKAGYSPIGFVRCGRSACKITKIDWKVRSVAATDVLGSCGCCVGGLAGGVGLVCKMPGVHMALKSAAAFLSSQGWLGPRAFVRKQQSSEPCTTCNLA
jgi:hypothetical protein